MSVQAITWALTFPVKNPTEKAILLVLANYADGDGVCFPGQDSIAKQAACTDRTVRAVLAAFEERGIIERVHRQRRDGSRTSDEIRLVNFKVASEAQPEKSSARPTGNLRTSNRKSTSGQPEGYSGLTTFEPSEEPSGEPAQAALAEVKAKSSPWDADPNFTAAWASCTPEMKKRAKSKAVAWREWKRAITREKPEVIAQAVKTYVRTDPDVRRTGGPGLQKWLKDQTWESVQPEAPSRPSGPIDPRVQAGRLAHFSKTGDWRPEWGDRPANTNTPARGAAA